MPFTIIYLFLFSYYSNLTDELMTLWVQGFLSKLTKKTYAPVEMLSKEEVERDTLLQLFLARHQGTDGCWLAFKCTRNFLHDSDVTVKIDGNVHSFILPRFAIHFHSPPYLDSVRRGSACDYTLANVQLPHCAKIQRFWYGPLRLVQCERRSLRRPRPAVY